MVLGTCYSVFDGTELLEYSINCIRKYTDYVCVLYQTKNWYGSDISEFDMDNINKLRVKGLADDIIHYELPYYATIPHHATGLEHGKRSFAKRLCLDKGCDYYFDIDVDEFFIPEEFNFAKKFIVDNNISKSKLEYYNYYKLEYRSVDPEGVSSFICKIDDDILNSCRIDDFFSDTDPTRKYGVTHNSNHKHKFKKNEICMHNMTGVRKNVKGKYSNSSRINLRRDMLDSLEIHLDGISGDNYNLNYEYFRFPGMMINNIKLKKVENIFNIKL